MNRLMSTNPRIVAGILVALVLLAFLGATASAVLLGTVVSSNQSRWMLGCSALLLLGSAGSLLLSFRFQPGTRRRTLGIVAVIGLVGSLLWAYASLGQWSYDSGLSAIAGRDYERAEALMHASASAHDVVGVTVRAQDGGTARLGVRGLLLYERWDATSWEAVALYGQGKRQEARLAMQGAIRSAKAAGADAQTIELMQRDLLKMGGNEN